jgi:DNA polymerase-3 subunit epsilon
MMSNSARLAFLDLETRGFSPRKGERIVEVAIITTDWEGQVQDRFETLVNPLREVTGTEIHGFTAEPLWV